jgi:DNA polymerase-3 subunit gamma/tau
MVLVRLCHAADLPTPDEAIRMIADADGAPPPGGERVRAPSSAARPARAQAAPRLQPTPAEDPSPTAAPTLRRFEDVVERARAERDRLLVFALERHVRPVRFEPGRIEIALTADAERDLPQRLMAALNAWTGMRWMVTVNAAEAGETVHEARSRKQASLFEEAGADPLVRRVLEAFPGAEIVAVRERAMADDAPAEIDDFPDAAEPPEDEDI